MRFCCLENKDLILQFYKSTKRWLRESLKFAESIQEKMRQENMRKLKRKQVFHAL